MSGPDNNNTVKFEAWKRRSESEANEKYINFGICILEQETESWQKKKVLLICTIYHDFHFPNSNVNLAVLIFEFSIWFEENIT
jgi:hypothetical protein